MYRNTRMIPVEDNTAIEVLLAPDVVHDSQLAHTMHRLAAPPPPQPALASAPRSDVERAVYGLD